jgi:glycerate 2-kinase
MVEQRNVRIVDNLIDADTPIYSITIGKAAGPMAQALVDMLGDRIVGGVITCPEGTARDLPGTWRQFNGGHPLPNADSLAAAEAAFTILDQANAEEATVIFAISGGGSAMIEWPVNPYISLSDLQQANRVLVTSGATIAEVNTVRRAFSAVKGGKLAGRAPNAEPITLILSDTNRGDEANVASGPTLPASNSSTANEIVQRFKLDAKLPASILRAIGESTELPLSPNARGSHYVLADNRTALESAAGYASSLGFQPVIAESISEQQIVQGCRALLTHLKELPPPVCLISGGEFSCPVVGKGLGGRNSETVLRCVQAIDCEKSDIVVLSVGTDGIDGSSPAAGAIADNETLSRACALGLNADEYLKRSDSYSFFSQLGDAIVTGPTGTNVRDLRILLKN